MSITKSPRDSTIGGRGVGVGVGVKVGVGHPGPSQIGVCVGGTGVGVGVGGTGVGVGVGGTGVGVGAANIIAVALIVTSSPPQFRVAETVILPEPLAGAVIVAPVLV